jgi:hypothetical protein
LFHNYRRHRTTEFLYQQLWRHQTYEERHPPCPTDNKRKGKLK